MLLNIYTYKKSDRKGTTKSLIEYKILICYKKIKIGLLTYIIAFVIYMI